MYKKFLLTLILIFSFSNNVYSKEIPILVRSSTKISTANSQLKTGDCINFVVSNDVYINSKLYIKAGEKVSGIITNLSDNGYNCQEASLYAEDFKTKNIYGNTVKLNGIIYEKGRTHWMFTQIFVVLYPFIRGGELNIFPEDTFTLYMDV